MLVMYLFKTKNNTTRALCTDSVAYAFLSSLRTPEKTVDIQHSEAEREQFLQKFSKPSVQQLNTVYHFYLYSFIFYKG
uniref:Secreted protein n=1 Tax=Heterorhabditis bacteriophora TaxID=37862 RepID=A0A1I7WAU1_HETBA